MLIPMNSEVKWNLNEKIIGVLGLAPAATADFYTKLVQLTPAKKDWEHVKVIIDSNPKIPSRGRYFELNEINPVPFIRHSILQLQQMGAGIIAVPCNTAHILYADYTADMTVTIPNMIESTVKAVKEICVKPHFKVAVFASRLTQQYKLYNDLFAKEGGIIVDTAAHQNEISALIESVKQGVSLNILTHKMHTILLNYTHADVFVMGCTELSLLHSKEFHNIPIVDSNIALAETCLALTNNKAFTTRFKNIVRHRENI